MAVGLDQIALGALMDVGQSAVSKWENGGSMGAELLPRLAVTLGARLDALVAGVDADYDAFAGTTRPPRAPRTNGDAYVRAILNVVKSLGRERQLLLLNVARSYGREPQNAPAGERIPETPASTPPAAASSRRRAAASKRERER